ncbi:hypothetical protein HNR46_003201 [Haloferula luteola]|uniref:Uncharacterized protein n=1 Tax=Haloferula luteola TaxID=595692 RepID=A0A840VJU0_9BACT|nr:hypothetical protein [Haloferula luteola]MBB5352951.1 hypothetical protein [Haloferula luteola]
MPFILVQAMLFAGGAQLVDVLRPWIIPHYGFPVFCGLAVVVTDLLGKTLGPKATLTWYQPSGASRRRSLRMAMEFGGAGLGMGLMGYGTGSGWAAIGGWLVGAWGVSWILRGWSPRMLCRHEDGGWYEILGIPLETLQKLSALQSHQKPRNGRNLQWKRR